MLFPAQDPLTDAHAEVGIAQAAREFPFVLAFSWALVAIYSAVAFVYGATFAGYIDLIGSIVVWPFTIWLFRRGHWTVANYVLLVSSTFYIFVGQILIGRYDGFIFFYLPVGVSPFMLFRPSQRRHMIAGVAIVFSGWILCEIEAVHAWGRPFLPPNFPSHFSHFVNFGGAFLMVIAIIDLYARANRRLRIEQVDQADLARADLQQAFDQIALSERNLSMIFDTMVDAIMIQDADGNVRQVNDIATSKFGLSKQFNMFATHEWRAYTQDGRLLEVDELPSRVALATGQPQIGVPLDVRRDDGAHAYVTINSVPYRDDGAEGPPTHVVTTMIDVTAQRKAERLLYQIVNGTPDWIFIKDREHRYLNINEAFAKALGRTPSEVIGKNDLELGFKEADVVGDPTRGRRGFWRDDDLVFETNRLHTFAEDYFFIDGKERCFHTIKTPLYQDNPNEPYAILCYSRDITHLREIEERLVQSSKMASLGQMAGGIAHEINNPLAIIQGKAQVLLMDLAAGRADPESLRDTVGKIVETAKRIAKIVRGLQTFSRDGEADPFAVVAFLKIVDEAVSLCRDKFRKSNVTLEVGDVPSVEVLGNGVQLSQVLINLLNNAHDAVAGSAGPWVRVDFETGAQGVKTSVVDGGPGIPDAVADKLMQPFFTTKPAGKGTGLGLMLSQKIIDRHRGKLYLDRTAPQTRFVIELPVHDPAMNALS